jgi:hypothetical protein
MSSQQVYDIYPVCQKFLLDFGFKQNGDNFTYRQQPEDLGNVQFNFPSIVTDNSIKVLCSNLIHLLDEDSDETTWRTTQEKVAFFCEFISSIQHLFQGFMLTIVTQSKTIANMRQELKELKATTNQ